MLAMATPTRGCRSRWRSPATVADDNSPPGNAISYPTIHSSAGGVGTYADPITFATDKKEYPPGTILYVPFIEKYVIMEDDCVQCDSDWKLDDAPHRHLDEQRRDRGLPTRSSAARTAGRCRLPRS